MASAQVIPTSIPMVQTKDYNTNQLQTNIIKGFRHIQNQAMQAIDNLQSQVSGITVTASQINSQSATVGQLLEANGNGGASWVTPAKTVCISTGTPGTSPTGSITNGTRYTLIFQTVQIDTNSAYNTSSGTWTCPVAGVYDLFCVIMLTGSYSSVGACYMQIASNGTSNIVRETLSIDNGSVGTKSFSITATMSLSLNQTINFCFVTEDWTSVSFENANYTHWMSICQRP